MAGSTTSAPGLDSLEVVTNWKNCKEKFIADPLNTEVRAGTDFGEVFSALVCGPLFAADGKLKSVEWTAKAYGCQNIEVDEDHQELFDLINGIVTAVQKADIKGISNNLRGLRRYTVYHFAREISVLRMVPRNLYSEEDLKKHEGAHKVFVGILNLYLK